MVEVIHRVKVFVYRFGERRPDYLLLRRPGYESFWGPVHGPLGLGEQLETATMRSVMRDLGIGRPVAIHDLQCPMRWLVGDEQVIEWSYGCRAPGSETDVHLDPHWAAFRWAGIADAYPALELETDRVALMRLHAIVSAA